MSLSKKDGQKTTDLIFHLLTHAEFEIVANDVLVAEYEKYARSLNAEELLEFLKLRITVVNPSEGEVETCRPYFPENDVADVVYAATCLKTKAVLITNDSTLAGLKSLTMIKVWGISEAMIKILKVS